MASSVLGAVLRLIGGEAAWWENGDKEVDAAAG
jgi:hypothetical protein